MIALEAVLAAARPGAVVASNGAAVIGDSMGCAVLV